MDPEPANSPTPLPAADSPAARATSAPPHRRRPRYSGKYPRRFEEKYKELDPARDEETFRKVLASGKTPAGTHRPILVSEILEILKPTPGSVVVDCTLGYGGHSAEILPRIQPGGRLIGLDADSIELPKTEARLRAGGFGPDTFSVYRSNFAGLPAILVECSLPGADAILADLGVSSMQLDDPSRGFSVKHDGPLDMRMNPNRGQPASVWLEKIRPEQLAGLLLKNADEARAQLLAPQLAGQRFSTTRQLADAIRSSLPNAARNDVEMTLRRVFQAIRIAVNDEFSALDSLLRQIPACLNPGGRFVVLTFHSGEDRRVKRAFEGGMREGIYSEISTAVLRPSAEERQDNPRSSPAKLRWARRAVSGCISGDASSSPPS
ncbi:MAG: 16S rRNA (cytosine(1402)-N(4))-methyltransferase RsmH [Pedosphaera sp.]|nr:16S rRNA (cytosine(1402)-N(4))-methyltransferase RsmH [Pedosphaera sp.]